MSILIKGMEMPTSCFDNVMLCNDGRVFVYKNGGWVKSGTAVPVPPHGRLIDADALVDKHFGKEFLTKVMTADEDDIGTALVNVPLVINNAPTIIPADPAEEGE